MESRLVLLMYCKKSGLTCLLCDSLLTPTGITVIWAGDNHSGLVWGRKREEMGLGDCRYIRAASLKCIWLHSQLLASPHHFPPKFSARIAIILSSDPSTALWIITGLCNCPSRLGEREGKKVTQQGVGWWFCQKISHWYGDKMIRPQ